ncbi:MAG TPA: hypothetical protein VK422_04635, partial [Pyrinomonadaceae bacterium]|nr:hypothetical protein [Pyrinomonadaceae bacterium]
QVLSPSRLFLARGLKFGETEQEETEDIRPLKVSLEEAVRMVMAGEITQALTGLVILKAERIVREEREGRERKA